MALPLSLPPASSGRPALRLGSADARLLAQLRDGLPLCDRPFAVLAERLGLGEAQLIERLGQLLARGTLRRIGPIYRGHALEGHRTAAALRVAEPDLDAVVALVNAHPQVRRSLLRRHPVNLWFEVAADSAEQAQAVLQAIARETGLTVMDQPNERVYGLQWLPPMLADVRGTAADADTPSSERT